MTRIVTFVFAAVFVAGAGAGNAFAQEIKIDCSADDLEVGDPPLTAHQALCQLADKIKTVTDVDDLTRIYVEDLQTTIHSPAATEGMQNWWLSVAVGDAILWNERNLGPSKATTPEAFQPLFDPTVSRCSTAIIDQAYKQGYLIQYCDPVQNDRKARGEFYIPIPGQPYYTFSADLDCAGGISPGNSALMTAKVIAIACN